MHIASPLSVHPFIRTYKKWFANDKHPYVLTSVRTKNGFRTISLENIGVLDSYFIHMYIIIKYSSSSIMDKIHQLLSELWPLISE